MKTIKYRLVTLLGLLVLNWPTAWAQLLRDIEPAIDELVDRQVDRIEEQTTERLVDQVEEIQDETVEQIQNQALERVESQTLEQVIGQVDGVEDEALERVQNQIEQVQNQIDRAQDQAGRIIDELPIADRVGPDIVNDLGERARERLQALADNILPERLDILDRDGNTAFVEIQLEDNIRAIEYQWVMLLDAGQRERLQVEAPELLEYLTETQTLIATDSELLVFEVPPELNADDVILELLPEDMRNLMDRNHVYSARNEPSSQSQTEDRLAPAMTSVCDDAINIGMIDSAVKTEHLAFTDLDERGVTLESENFIQGELQQPVGHGTAVAGLLIGRGESLQPLLPGATLYSASVMYSQDSYNQGTTVVHLIRALDWMTGQELRVINMSLSGPDNRLLARAIAAASEADKIIVAAAGNEGPYANPQYPAAYEQVISVTAVASDYSIYRWANQGDYIDYAAFGVSVMTARNDGNFGRESGTSMATPVVSAFVACALADGSSQEQALAKLQIALRDLGEPGRDKVFGLGLLQTTDRAPGN